MNKQEQALVEKELGLLFKIYDLDNSGELDRDELYLVLNDLRKQLSLGGLPEDLFSKCFKILDKDGGGTISSEELLGALEEIFPILCQPDDEIINFIKKKFRDYDDDDSGYLERNELRMIFDGICEQMKLQNCEAWRVDYIISIIDDDGNGKIDFDEFMYNYNTLYCELEKNPPLGISEAKYRLMVQARDENKIANANELNVLSNLAKKMLRSKKKTDIQQAREIQNEDNRIDELNTFSFKNSRQHVPINYLVNEKPLLIEPKEPIAITMDKDNTTATHTINAIKNSARKMSGHDIQEPTDLILRIAKEFDSAIGGDMSPDKHINFFQNKNYDNIEEITKVGCDSLIQLKRLMLGLTNFICSRKKICLNGFSSADLNDDTADESDNKTNLKDLESMTKILNDTFSNFFNSAEQEQIKNVFGAQAGLPMVHVHSLRNLEAGQHNDETNNLNNNFEYEKLSRINSFRVSSKGKTIGNSQSFLDKQRAQNAAGQENLVSQVISLKNSAQGSPKKIQLRKSESTRDINSSVITPNIRKSSNNFDSPGCFHKKITQSIFVKPRISDKMITKNLDILKTAFGNYVANANTNAYDKQRASNEISCEIIPESASDSMVFFNDGPQPVATKHIFKTMTPTMTPNISACNKSNRNEYVCPQKRTDSVTRWKMNNRPDLVSQTTQQMVNSILC